MNVTTQTTLVPTLVQHTGLQADVSCSRVMHDVLDAIMNLNPKPDCRVMYDVLDAMMNLSDVRILPHKGPPLPSPPPAHPGLPLPPSCMRRIPQPPRRAWACDRSVPPPLYHILHTHAHVYVFVFRI